MTARLQVSGASRSFGGVRALREVSMRLEAGRVTGLVGHNGAGKSTLVRAISGADPLDAGTIAVDGRTASLRTPREARSLGIETLYQDLALAESLDGVANLFLGRERTRFGRLDEARMEREAREVLGRLGADLSTLRRPVRHLSGGQRQAIAFARALLFDARVLVLDEPTAALGPTETAAVHGVIRQLAAEGLAVLVVSHDLGGLLDLADHVVVLRTGAVVADAPTKDLSRDTVLGWMVAGEPVGR